MKQQRSDWAINKQIDRRIKELGGGGQGGMVQHANEYHDPDMALATHNHDSAYVNEADHTKAAHDALDIDADTLDSHDTAYFETPAGAQSKVDTHAGIAAPHSGHETPSGAQAKVDTHKGADVSATVHPNANTHIGASAPHAGHALDSEFDAHVALTTSAHGGLLASTAFVGLAKITVGTGQPGSPSVGDLWIDTN